MMELEFFEYNALMGVVRTLVAGVLFLSVALAFVYLYDNHVPNVKSRFTYGQMLKWGGALIIILTVVSGFVNIKPKVRLSEENQVRVREAVEEGKRVIRDVSPEVEKHKDRAKRIIEMFEEDNQ